ncbi:TIGR03619 family F420-dependent LLM class oxidoreductase [Gordonia sp. NPDC127522]|uniref:TIGR03619 family F420-dependent LLM class oxidoreductase n=1 Tax=Gordonia sp. NPDC127522 TaxID=3345390 RepID=UPI00362517C2
MNYSGRRPKVMLAMSELLTLLEPKDERRHLDMAKAAEDEGISSLFVSEHVVMGGSANALGAPEEPRDWVRPGMQDPATPWPSPLIKLAAIAGATSTIRLVAAALIAPLRHPIIAAKDMATLDLISGGRLTVMPSVSWHVEEYQSLQVDFATRGRRLDEHLMIWEALWRDTPATHHGEFYQFDDTYFSPKPSSGRVTTWFGGDSLSPALLRRVCRHGDGLFLGFPLDTDDRDRLDAAMRDVGRRADELEIVGWVAPPEFPRGGGPADIERALEAVAPTRLAAGCDTLAIKPSAYIDSPDEMADFCRSVNRTLANLFPES